MSKAIMHLDGCHFFVWVGEQDDGTVTLSYDERRGSDLFMHGRFHPEDGDEPCKRCLALRRGAARTSVSRIISDFPDDSREAMGRVFEELATIQEVPL